MPPLPPSRVRTVSCLTLSPKINFQRGDYYLDGPIYLKSGVTLGGGFSDDAPRWPFLQLYDDPNSGNTVEDAIIVVDGATGAEVRPFSSE